MWMSYVAEFGNTVFERDIC